MGRWQSRMAGKKLDVCVFFLSRTIKTTRSVISASRSRFYYQRSIHEILSSYMHLFLNVGTRRCYRQPSLNLRLGCPATITTNRQSTVGHVIRVGRGGPSTDKHDHPMGVDVEPLTVNLWHILGICGSLSVVEHVSGTRIEDRPLPMKVQSI